MRISFPPTGFGDCQTLLLQGSCLVSCSFGNGPFEPFHVVPVVVFFSCLLSYVFLFLLRSPFAARPLALLEGVRIVLGRLPCP